MSGPSRITLLSRAIVGHPWRVLLAIAAYTLSIAVFLPYVAPSVSYKDMLGEDYPLLAVYDEIQAEYTRDDNLLVFVEARSGDAFTPELLAGMRELTEDLWQTPFSTRVDSVSNFQHIRAEGDDLAISDLVGADDALSGSRASEIRQIALNEPLMVGRVVNESGSVLAANVSFAFPNIDMNEKPDADAHVQAVAEAFRAEHGNVANVYVGGLVALDAAVMAISMKESGLFLMLVTGIVLVLMGLLLRRISPLAASLPVFLISVMSAMSLAGMLGWKLTPFTSVVPMLVLVISVADCVHLSTQFAARMGRGQGKIDALTGAMSHTMGPIIITSVTTALGLLTLNFSDSGSINALGNQSAFGVMAACLLSLTLLPALLALLPATARAPRPVRLSRFYAHAAETIFRLRYTLAIGSVVLGLLGGVAALTLNRIDDRIPAYFSESLPWRQANDFSEREFGGAYTFSYTVSSGEAGGISEPEFLRSVETFAEWLRDQPKVAYVNSVTDTFARVNESMHGGDPAFYAIPDSREEAAQYLLLYEMSLPYGLDLNNQINMDKSSTKVLASFETMSTQEVLVMETHIAEWAATHFGESSVRGTGVQVMFSHLMSHDSRALTLGALYGLVAISGLLILLFRSVRVGLVSLLPNLLPIFLSFGVWGLCVGQVGMGLAMVSGMSIGIVVDDTVHFLSTYLSARRDHGLDVVEGVQRTFEEVGPSMVFTTVVLVCGFLVMGFLSDFRVNSDMGWMTSLILLWALALDLIALPALLMIFHSHEPADPSAIGASK